MPTNILAIPKVTLDAVTGNNEDWIDSLKYLVEVDGGTIDTYPQLDLRGIRFEMEVRREADDHEVILSASTDDGSLSIGSAPDYGFLIINIPYETMKAKFAGIYVGDVVASADNIDRVVIQMTLEIIEGVTKWP
jgi:hypothetical protein